MTRTSDLENEIAQIQQRISARADLINREVETVAPLVRLASNNADRISGSNIGKAAKDHPVATALSTISTLYLAAKETGLLDRLELDQKWEQLKGGATQKASETVTSAQASAVNATSKASRTAKAKADEVASLAANKTSEASEFVQKNPLAVGLLAAGIGAAAASIFLMKRDADGDAPSEKKPVVVKRKRTKKAVTSKKPAAPKAPTRRKSVAEKAGASKVYLKARQTSSRNNGATLNGPSDSTAKPVDEILRS
jgi:ElaB/YqjD/DUF883 family membrane-anchored ribosome-binding protein